MNGSESRFRARTLTSILSFLLHFSLYCKSSTRHVGIVPFSPNSRTRRHAEQSCRWAAPMCNLSKKCKFGILRHWDWGCLSLQKSWLQCNYLSVKKDKENSIRGLFLPTKSIFFLSIRWKVHWGWLGGLETSSSISSVIIGPTTCALWKVSLRPPSTFF